MPSYYENNPESPHIYGLAVDLKVVDYPPEGLIDDWGEIAQLLTDHGINFIDTGDYSYVHAEYHFDPLPEQMIEVTITPNVVEPGWGTDYHQVEETREFNITGSISPSLSPFTGELVLRVNEVRYSGGHMVIGRTMNHDPDPNRITDINPDGSFEATYEDTCQWGGQIQVTAYYIDGYLSHTNADTASITFDYLEDLENHIGADPGVVKYTGGNDDYPPLPSGEVHPFNHYIDDNQTDCMQEIINEFGRIVETELDTLPPEFWINDISLPDGGRFTIAPGWWSYQYHSAHRQGAQADVKFDPTYWVIESERWEILRETIRDLTGKQPLQYHSHFHMFFDPRPLEN